VRCVAMRRIHVLTNFREMHNELLARLDALDGQPSTNSLLDSKPSHEDHSTASLPDSVVGNRTDLPLPNANAEATVKFYSHTSYKSFKAEKKNSPKDDLRPPQKGRGRRSQGENTRFMYLETIEGTPVSGERLDAISKFSRSLFQTLADAGIAPRTWGKKSAAVSSFYHRSMCSQFPEFTYCADNWKSEAYATEHYAAWSPKHCDHNSDKPSKRKRTSCVKDEDTGVDDDLGSGKCDAEGDVEKTMHQQKSKRMRVARYVVTLAWPRVVDDANQ
jgi:hypothetical protein